MKKIYFLLPIIVLTVLLGGCGTQTYTEKKVEAGWQKALGEKADVSVDKNGLKLKTKEGLEIQSGEEIKLPADFPKDVYVLEGKLKSAIKNPAGGYSVGISTSKPVGEVEKIYKEKLTTDGWQIIQQMDLGEGKIIMANKSERTVSVSISDKDGATFVVLTVMAEN